MRQAHEQKPTIMKEKRMPTIPNLNPVTAGIPRRLPGGSTISVDGHDKPNRPITVPALVVALALFSGIVGASRAAVIVESPHATVAGKTIGAWSAGWWQWAAAMAPPGDSFSDTTGEFANVNQRGPVFFLAGSPGGSNSRQFTVPANTYLLMPLLCGELSQLELGFNQTAAQIQQAARQQADNINSLHATLDGISIPQATLYLHREVSPNFSFVAVAGNLVYIPPGASGIAVADGYFLMISPLPPGTYVLNYGGGATVYGVFIDETDTITVAPPVELTSPNVSAGQFSFDVTGPPGSTVIIEASTDLSNWQAVGTNVLTGGASSFTTGVQADGPQFFRASAAP